jgi:hypothetical protein
MCFTNTAQIKIRALRVHALISNAADALVASVASRMMPGGEGRTTRQEVVWIGDLDEAMIGVLFIYDTEARNTYVEVRTVHTFVAGANDPRVTEVTRCIMRAWCVCDSRRVIRLGSVNASIATPRLAEGISFAVPGEHGVHDNSAWFLHAEELVERIMALRSASIHTRRAQIVIRTIKTLVSHSDNGVIAQVATNSDMHERRSRSGRLQRDWYCF